MAVGDKFSDEFQKVLLSVPSAMFRIGELAANMIRNRTRQQGLSAFATAFTPYSKKYAARRGKSMVDLTDTGDMLNSIGVMNGDGTQFDPRGRGSKFRGQPGNAGQFVSARDVEINVGPSNDLHKRRGNSAKGNLTHARLAAVHQKGSDKMNLPSRPHIGLTEQEQGELARVMSRELYQTTSTSESISIDIRLG